MPATGSATRGGTAGTPCGSSRRPGIDALPGLRFPAPRTRSRRRTPSPTTSRPTRRRLQLPIRTGHRVDELSRADDGRSGYRRPVGDRRFEADQVVVATGAYERTTHPGRSPASSIRSIRQFHSRDYRNPSQLRDGDVLVVGASNSGAEIALDVAAGSSPSDVAGRPDVGEIPIDTDGRLAPLVRRVIIFASEHILTLGNPIGRRAAAGPCGTTACRSSAPRRKQQRAAGVERVSAESSACATASRCSTMAGRSRWRTSSGPRATGPDVRLDPAAGRRRRRLADPAARRGLRGAGPLLPRAAIPLVDVVGAHRGVGRDAEYIVGRIAAHRKAASARRKTRGAEPDAGDLNPARPVRQ